MLVYPVWWWCSGPKGAPFRVCCTGTFQNGRDPFLVHVVKNQVSWGGKVDAFSCVTYGSAPVCTIPVSKTAVRWQLPGQKWCVLPPDCALHLLQGCMHRQTKWQAHKRPWWHKRVHTCSGMPGCCSELCVSPVLSHYVVSGWFAASQWEHAFLGPCTFLAISQSSEGILG